MNAEIGIGPDGRVFLTVTPQTLTERALMQYVRPWLPLDTDEGSGTGVLIGERLPGSGKGG